MNTELKQLCENFIETKRELKQAMKFEITEIYTPCAMMYINKGVNVNKDMIDQSKKTLKNTISAFSYLRSISKVPFITMLSLSENKELLVDKTLNFYNAFKKYFFKTNYVALCSLMFSDIIDESNYDAVFNKAKTIYKEFKKEHRFITDGADLIMCLILANTNESMESITTKTEEYFSILKEEFFSSNSVQTLSHILTLQNGNVKEVSTRFFDLYNTLTENGIKYGTSIELGTLGLLSLTDVSIDQLLFDFKDVDNFLKEQKGYNVLFVPTKKRYLHVTMLLLNYYNFNNSNINNALLTNISLQYIIAQQLMCATATTAVIASS